MFALESNLTFTIFLLSIFILFDYHRAIRCLHRQMSSQHPATEPKAQKEIKDTQTHIANTLEEMKKSTHKKGKLELPSVEWFEEMQRALGFQWTDEKDNILLLAIAKQKNDEPNFEEIAEMLGWCSAKELMHRHAYLRYTITMRAIHKKEEARLEEALAKLRAAIDSD